MEKLRLASFVLFVDDVSISKNFYEKILNQEVSASSRFRRSMPSPKLPSRIRYGNFGYWRAVVLNTNQH